MWYSSMVNHSICGHTSCSAEHSVCFSQYCDSVIIIYGHLQYLWFIAVSMVMRLNMK